MGYLYNILDELSIKEILEIEENIQNVSNEDVKEKVDLLKIIGCTDKQIRNIIVSNPLYLLEETDNVKLLINKFYNLGLEPIDYLIDENPNLLTRAFDYIDEFIYNKLSNGYNVEDIRDLILNDSSIIYN